MSSHVKGDKLSNLKLQLIKTHNSNNLRSNINRY